MILSRIKKYIPLLFLPIIACDNDGDFNVEIPDFNYPQTVVFEAQLSAYEIFAGSPNQLNPNQDYHLLELSSVLYTDYAHKQRLIKVPEGTELTRLNDGSLDFPNGSILVKTFFYYHDERDTTLGKRIIESRLLIKEDNVWNAATYVWNEAQTDASLRLAGGETTVTWTDFDGNQNSINYLIPNENQCIACHQSSNSMIPLGTKLRNLNRHVDRNGSSVEQISHLQSIGILNAFPLSSVPTIPDYKDESYSLGERARAYLDLNCSHSHQPNGWEIPAEEDFNFTYEVSLTETGILSNIGDIEEVLEDGEMPFIGTTIIDQEGVALLLEYLEGL